MSLLEKLFSQPRAARPTPSEPLPFGGELTFSCVNSLMFVDIAWSQSVLSAAVQN